MGRKKKEPLDRDLFGNPVDVRAEKGNREHHSLAFRKMQKELGAEFYKEGGIKDRSRPAYYHQPDCNRSTGTGSPSESPSDPGTQLCTDSDRQ